MPRKEDPNHPAITLAVQIILEELRRMAVEDAERLEREADLLDQFRKCTKPALRPPLRWRWALSGRAEELRAEAKWAWRRAACYAAAVP